MIQHVQGMAGIAWCNRGMPHRAKILVTRCKTASAEMRAAKVRPPDRMAGEAAAMSAKVPAAKMACTAAAEMMPPSAAAEATSAATVAASMAATSGDGIARQGQKERKNRNSQRAPEHGTLPAVSPPTTWRKW